MGTVASAHHMDVLNGLALLIVGIALGLEIIRHSLARTMPGATSPEASTDRP